MKHPLLVCKLFAEKNQGTHQTVTEYTTKLSKLFKEAHPSEDVSSTVLLNRFLSGLKPAAGHQVLFKEQPRTLAAAVKIEREVEFAMQFGQGQVQEEISTVCALQTQQLAQQESIDKLTTAVEELMKRLDGARSRPPDHQPQSNAHPYRRPNRNRMQCYTSVMNLGTYSPLNGQQSVPRKGVDWLPSQPQ